MIVLIILTPVRAFPASQAPLLVVTGPVYSQQELVRRRRDMAKVWVRRIGFGLATVLALVGGYAAFNRNTISAHYTAAQFRSATTDEARIALATKLLATGEPGETRLVETLRTGTPEQCQAVVVVIAAKLKEEPESTICRPVLSACGSFGEAGQTATLDLVPDLLNCGEPDAAERCKELVTAALEVSSVDVKRRAIRLAAAPQFGLKLKVVPLLMDPSSEVRREAMLATGPLGIGEQVIETEELFPWLNDPDVEVRMVCEGALSTRGLTPEQIEAGRKLTHPEASTRLQLVVDIWRGRGGVFRDPGPWLERLSRDPDAAVRAATARVAYESQLTFANWLDRLAEDADPTVRRIVAYHRNRAEQLKQAGFGGR